ncbi:unnamed protein product [Ilex paraguariensis]|uniref:Uncharacterized protein n=1 Tax=Ilex paraguariensis TaxID=185542 RepID=A0ABC8TWU1_9AQUA
MGSNGSPFQHNRSGSNQAPSRSGFKHRQRTRSDHYGREGHTAAKCYKLHEHPPHSNDGTSSMPRSQPHGLVASSEKYMFPSPSSTPIPIGDQSSSLLATPISQEQNNHILAILQQGRNEPSTNFVGIALTSFQNNSWIIDSGATNDKCSTPRLLHTMSPNTALSNVQMSNGSPAPITQIGVTSINSSLHYSQPLSFSGPQHQENDWSG